MSKDGRIDILWEWYNKFNQSKNGMLDLQSNKEVRITSVTFNRGSERDLTEHDDPLIADDHIIVRYVYIGSIRENRRAEEWQMVLKAKDIDLIAKNGLRSQLRKL